MGIKINGNGHKNRANRWVCEKIAQNVAQPIFLIINASPFFHGRKADPKCGLCTSVCNFQKNCPI
jgi:hypothetical protein